jgi:hypothetical protein
MKTVSMNGSTRSLVHDLNCWYKLEILVDERLAWVSAYKDEIELIKFKGDSNE